MGRKLQPGVDKISEAWVKKEVKLLLAPYKNLYYWMPQASMFGESGQHDFSICQGGLLWTIETKAGKNKPTENQIRFADDIHKAGGISLLINEYHLNLIVPVAYYINTQGKLPMHLGHDFTVFRKK
jgi:hypothetical protein